MDANSMLTQLGSLLDEDLTTSEFISSAEAYSALSRGQNQIINLILAIYKAKLLVNPSEPLPEILRSVYNITTQLTSSTSIQLAPNFIYDLSVYIAGTYNKPLLKRELSKALVFNQADPYLGTTQNEFYYLSNNSIILEIPTPTNLNVTLEWLNIPANIDGNAIPTPINPVLPEYTMSAIIQFAYSEFLKKMKRSQESALAYQQFLDLIKEI